jgi:quercetin dioxygenase-like cupin family protein
MATDDDAPDAVGGNVESEAGAVEDAGVGGAPSDEAAEDFHHFVEIWNDYDPSQQFTAIFPIGEKEGAVGSSVGYYIIEPGKHTGLHSDNAEEIAFVAEGEGELFSLGKTQRLEAGKFVVIQAGLDHDIYAHGADALRLLSFFPTTEILTTFQQVVYPVGGNVVSSKPPQPVVTELDPNNLPANFPFDLSELGMAGPDEPGGLTSTQRLLGMTEPDMRPESLTLRIYNPADGTVVETTTTSSRSVEEAADDAPGEEGSAAGNE